MLGDIDEIPGLQFFWDGFQLAAMILLPYKLHTSRSAAGETQKA